MPDEKADEKTNDTKSATPAAANAGVPPQKPGSKSADPAPSPVGDPSADDSDFDEPAEGSTSVQAHTLEAERVYVAQKQVINHFAGVSAPGVSRRSFQRLSWTDLEVSSDALITDERLVARSVGSFREHHLLLFSGEP